MVRAVVMPKLGQSEEQGTLVRWRKKEGDPVTKGDILFEIETDKAVLEVESFFEGTLLKALVPEGTVVPVQATVGFIGEPGEPIPEVSTPTVAAVSSPPSLVPTPRTSEGPPAISPEPPAASRGGRMEVRVQEKPSPVPAPVEAPSLFRISPRAAMLAREAVIDPTSIVGSGPAGRILERDVRAYLEARNYGALRITPAARQLAGRENIDILCLRSDNGTNRIEVADVERAVAEKPKAMTRMRQVIAARLTESYTTTPHFFVTVSVDMTDLARLRSELKADGKTYTLTDFIVMAAVQALAEFPAVNSTSDGKTVQWHSRVHLGLAVALDEGLVVPVIRNADRLSLPEIHDRATDLTAKARAGKLTPNEMKGSTFTISNMGMLDVENFTAIINPGESAILAVSSTLEQAVVRAGQIVVRNMMKMTLSSDHRIVDGATAARFTNAIKKKLEEISLWKRLV